MICNSWTQSLNNFIHFVKMNNPSVCIVLMIFAGVIPWTLSELENKVEPPPSIPKYLKYPTTTPDSLETYVVREGQLVQLTCPGASESGHHTQAKITWEKQDGTSFTVRDDSNGSQKKVTRFVHQILTLANVTRTEMGIYLCTTVNEMGTQVSKKVKLQVNFPPTVQGNRYLNSLECIVEAWPKASGHWVKVTSQHISGNILSPTSRMCIHSRDISEYGVSMSLRIRNFSPDDYGVYQCYIENSVGNARVNITVFGKLLKPPSTFDESVEGSGDGSGAGGARSSESSGDGKGDTEGGDDDPACQEEEQVTHTKLKETTRPAEPPTVTTMTMTITTTMHTMDSSSVETNTVDNEEPVPHHNTATKSCQQLAIYPFILILMMRMIAIIT